MSTIPVVGVYGHSNLGKTTLIEKLVSHLTKEGYRVATVKCSKKAISFDTEGKDTWRHYSAGSNLVVFSSACETDFLIHKSMDLSAIINILCQIGSFDVVLVEGAHDPDIPKIQIGAGKKRKNTVACYQNNFEEILSMVKKDMEMKHSFHGLSITVNGKNIPLAEFPEKIFTNAIVGMLHSLKGVSTITEVTIQLTQ